VSMTSFNMLSMSISDGAAGIIWPMLLCIGTDTGSGLNICGSASCLNCPD
jgi:hypothetical protein